LGSCNKAYYPDRSQFLHDGAEVPTVDLGRYKSVQERPGQDSTLGIGMAISGGGSRAANFGIGIMLGLEKIRHQNGQNALLEVDYLSTVSGGGFAGGAYINALYEHNDQGRDDEFSLSSYVERDIRQSLSHSYTGVLLRATLNPRLWFSYIDDGDALERAIDDYVLGYRSRNGFFGNKRSLLLSDVFIPANSSQPVRYPMLITNSTVLNTMTIFPFTPDILDLYNVCGYTHRMQHEREEELDVFSIPLAVGIKASGSFPVLISNSTLFSAFHDERRYLHLIDGAMTDNIGYYTALEVLQQDESPRKVIFVVDADASGSRFTFSEKRGAISSLKVLARLPSSGLDARRATLVKDILAVCEKQQITPIFFSFNQLLIDNEAPVPESIDIETEQGRLIHKLSAAQPLDDAEEQILYELLTYIGTKYTIEKDEQQLLFLAGQYLVKSQEAAILSALGWE
jgi:predicted acylesterase/phospholipase RssA